MHKGQGDMRLGPERAEFNLARLKKGGENFEIVINADEAVAYKEGKDVEVKDIMRSEKIFSHAQKGDLAPENDMEKIFGTKEVLDVAKVILDDGEIQLTESIRKTFVEKKFNKIVTTIAREAFDPKTNLPHPEERIRLAIDEAKLKVNPMRTAEEQIDEFVSKLKPILPISFEKKTLLIVIPAEYSPKCQHFVRSSSVIKNETYGDDGSWEIEVQIPGGMTTKLNEELNSLTKGSVKIKEI